MRRTLFSITIILLEYCIAGMTIQAQTKNAKAFRPKPAPIRLYEIRPSDVTYQLWEGFQLMRNANAGDAPSQHELGLRYLTGRGFPADTVRAALWVKRSAEQGYLLGIFNYGIFLNNGWGVDWDPFEAFRYFRTAAQKGMKEGEYVFGVFHTDHMVVNRDLRTAALWVQRSANQGYAPAKELMAELSRRGIVPQKTDNPDTIRSTPAPFAANAASLAVQPVLLEFDSDTSQQTDDLTLLKELFNEGNEEIRNVLGISRILSDSLQQDTTGISLIAKAAEFGNPEAMTVLARCYEKGIGVKKDRGLAAIHYIRAIRLDSRRALSLLWRMVNDERIIRSFQQQAQKQQPEAQYVLASLASLGFGVPLTDEQALQYLQLAAAKGSLPAVLDLGNCYSMGQWVKQDKKKAMEFWKRAAMTGSTEGMIRVAVAEVFEGTITDARRSFDALMKFSEQGSVLAQTALGYCYEKGIIVPIDVSHAVSLYRRSAQRGNQAAMSALQRLYDERRPKEPEFQIKDELP